MKVREAAPTEATTARSILDAAMLAVDEATFEGATVLVATEDDRILGAAVLADGAVDAIAVRPGRRGQGIGTALVEAAAERRTPLTVRFDPPVRPFYESLGFDIECTESRCRGRLE